MMEHEVPRNRLRRVLFYVRLLSIGLGKAREILGHEEDLFRCHFATVARVETDSRQSKVILGRKQAQPAPPEGVKS